jgi:hypothetical protein
MIRRRWALAGLAMIASLGLATAGCGNGNDSDSSNDTATAASPTPVDAKQALADSVKALAEGNFKFTMADHEATGSGSVHEPSKSAQMDMTIKDADGEGKIGFVVVGQDQWIKMDFGPEINQLLKLPKKWMHIDPAKVKDSETLKEMSVDFGNADEIDPAGSGTILKAVVTAEKTADGTYSGTVDLTKATDAGMVDEEVVTKLADKAKAIPFTATVDGQGRLTKLSLDMPAAGDVPAHKLEASYSDYGSATEAKKPPAGQTQEAPASAYELLNS